MEIAILVLKAMAMTINAILSVVTCMLLTNSKGVITYCLIIFLINFVFVALYFCYELFIKE